MVKWCPVGVSVLCTMTDPVYQSYGQPYNAHAPSMLSHLHPIPSSPHACRCSCTLPHPITAHTHACARSRTLTCYFTLFPSPYQCTHMCMCLLLQAYPATLGMQLDKHVALDTVDNYSEDKADLVRPFLVLLPCLLCILFEPKHGERGCGGEQDGHCCREHVPDTTVVQCNVPGGCEHR
jgi:hypothetical protein